MHTVRACKEEDFSRMKRFLLQLIFCLWAERDFAVTCDVRSSDIQICNLRRGMRREFAAQASELFTDFYSNYEIKSERWQV